MASVAAPVALYPAAAPRIYVGGEAITLMWGPFEGGLIWNPPFASQEGIPEVEPLYVDLTGNEAVLEATATCVAVQPGGSFVVPAQTTNVSVNAATSGHRFSAIVYQTPTPYPPIPQPGTFPPPGPTTLTETIPAYLYKEYDDDEDLQAFWNAYNEAVQVYVTWFAFTLLPIYTSATIFGILLDWVAEGLYGMQRPALTGGPTKTIGPLNTYGPNFRLPLNTRLIVVPQGTALVSDDVFKRILTWNFYKGDGFYFNSLWIKRRVMRFLIGVNGTAPNVPDTTLISVTWAPGQVAIRIAVGTRRILRGALVDRFGPNQFVPLNSLVTAFTAAPPAPALASVLREAIESGVLNFPFQYSVSIEVG